MMRAFVAALISCVFAIPAAAQSMELGGMGGFTPKTSLDRHAPEIDDVYIDGGVDFAINAAKFLTERWGVSVEWAQQFSGLGITTAGSDVSLYDIGIANLHGYAQYRFGDAAAKARPFVFGGGGMTLLSAHDLETETKLSFGLGGGLSYWVSQNIAIDGRLTYRTTIMNDSDAGDFCDAFGFCQSTLRQFDLMAGVKLRF